MPLSPEAQRIKDWRTIPGKFEWDNFKVEPDDWQMEELKLFGDDTKPKLRIAMQACAGPGKSAVLAWNAWKFLGCYGGKGEHPKGAAVAISRDNLKDNLWAELAKWRERSPYLKAAFEWQKERIFAKQHPETWFLSARAWPKKSNAEEQGRTLSGLHSEFVLALLDESGEIPPAVGNAAEQALSTSTCKWGRIVQAGNPTSLEGILYLASTDWAHLWNVIRITGDPDDPKRSKRIDKAWAQENIDSFGRDNPWVMSLILGLFPPASVNALIGPDEVADAMKRTIGEDAYNWAQKRMGIDAARFGDDAWAIFRRQGLASYPIITMRNPRTPDVAARAVNEGHKWGGDVKYFVDGTGGYGAGCIDAMLQVPVEVSEIQFGGAPIDPRFADKRSEMIWEFVEWIKRGGCLADNPKLKRQLTTASYTFKKSKLWVLPKDQHKKLLKGQSPDEMDSGSLTFALPDMARGLQGRVPGMDQEFARPTKPYDPFADMEGAISAASDDIRRPM